jgi:hypothetical protein
MKKAIALIIIALALAACGKPDTGSSTFSTSYNITLPSDTSFTVLQDGKPVSLKTKGNALDFSNLPDTPVTLKFITGDSLVMKKDNVSLNGKEHHASTGETIVLVRRGDKVEIKG